MLEKYIQTKIIPVVVVENEDETRKIAELCLEFLPSIYRINFKNRIRI